MMTSNVAPIEVGVWAPLSRMKLSPYAREHSAEDIASRAGSMARDGQLQNAIVVKTLDANFPDGWVYELVVGHGRYASAKANGWESMKVDLYEGLTESQKLSMALAENSEREEASPFYTARIYQAIMETDGITLTELSERLGKDLPGVTRCLALNQLSEKVRNHLDRSKWTMAHLREFLRLPDGESQIKVSGSAQKGDWSVRELKACVDKVLTGDVAKTSELVAPKLPFAFALKKGVITLKARAYEPQCETFEDYVQDLVAAFRAFEATQARPVAQVIVEEAPTQAAA